MNYSRGELIMEITGATGMPDVPSDSAFALTRTVQRFLRAFGVSLAYRHTESRAHCTVCAVGYPEELTDYLNSDFIEKDKVFQLVEDRPDELLAWRDLPSFRSSYAVRQWFHPYGVSEGVSMMLRDPHADGESLAGVLHVNLQDDSFPDRGLELLEAMRPELEALVAVERHRPPSPFTARESEVLKLIAEGMTNKEIAHTLYISPSTVRTHVESILRKAGASSRAEAVAKWADASASGPLTDPSPRHRGQL